MTTTTRTFNGTIVPGIVSERKPNDPAHHAPHVDPAKPGDDRHQSEYEQGQYLKAHGAEKNRLMKQFCKLEGPSGNSAAYQRGWDLAFGTPEAKARALAEIEAEKACGDPNAELMLTAPRCSTWRCPNIAIGFATSVVGARIPLCGPCATYAEAHQTQEPRT